jgi:hypothetical protein
MGVYVYIFRISGVTFNFHRVKLTEPAFILAIFNITLLAQALNS